MRFANVVAMHKVCRLEDIVPNCGVCALVEGEQVAVFRLDDDRVFAIEDHCPHKGGPLSQGIVHGASVTCPLHNWVISLETGKAQGADQGCVRTIPIRCEGETLLIASTSLTGRAA